MKKRTVILSLMTKIIRGNVRLQFYDCTWYDHETVSKWLYELSNFKSVELWKSWNMDITKFYARFSWYKILRFNKNLSSLAFLIEILFNTFKFVRNCFFFFSKLFLNHVHEVIGSMKHLFYLILRLFLGLFIHGGPSWLGRIRRRSRRCSAQSRSKKKWLIKLIRTH